jgi:very-short-patch-repair endonuclease
MAERRKLSLGNVTDRAEGRSAEDAARSWKISPRRAEELKQTARAMRRNPTPAQKALWERLKDKQCGFTFNREVVMGSAIVDFACKTRWLVVETGGEGEAGATLAALSDRKLTDVGVRVLRFSDDEVLADTDKVVKAIKDELQQPFERPRIEDRR